MGKIVWSTISKDADLFWVRYKELANKDLPVTIATGIHFSTLSTWKNKKLYPRADDACKIAEALNTTVEYLVTGKKSPYMVLSSAALEIALVIDKLTEEGLSLIKSMVESIALNHTREK